jgi:AbrB family looped-hinge helix DNA binding protein
MAIPSPIRWERARARVSVGILIKFLLFFIDGFIGFCHIFSMNTTGSSDAVWFTTKGQVVIPRRLRQQFHIEDGTKAIVEATEDGILLKPVTAVTIRRLRGILKRKPGDRPLAAEMAEHKRAEKELEEAKYARSTSPR